MTTRLYDLPCVGLAGLDVAATFWSLLSLSFPLAFRLMGLKDGPDGKDGNDVCKKTN